MYCTWCRYKLCFQKRGYIIKLLYIDFKNYECLPKWTDKIQYMSKETLL